jgi:hypothetical protein
MMLFVLAAFYATMATAGYLIELIFGSPPPSATGSPAAAASRCSR